MAKALSHLAHEVCIYGWVVNTSKLH